MPQNLLAQLYARILEVREKREALKNAERKSSQQASETRREIIKLDGAEEKLQEVYDSVKSAMEKNL